MRYRIIIAAAVLVSTFPLIQNLSEAATAADIVYRAPVQTIDNDIPTLSTLIETSPDSPKQEKIAEIELLNNKEEEQEQKKSPIDIKLLDKNEDTENKDVFEVPFFSQFNDITPVEWRKVGCGIASLAMLIEFYEPNSVTVDDLLQQGIKAGAYLSNAGWTHAGLINLSRKYGLDGASHDMAGQSMESAFSTLKDVLEEGPVMVSVHYTFDPKNPIPHLVVVNGVSDGKVYYNDPAEKSGGGSISISKFQSAWKKRYIQIQTTT